MEDAELVVLTTVDGGTTRIRATVSLADEPHEHNDYAALRAVQRAVEAEGRRRKLAPANDLEHEICVDEEIGRHAMATQAWRRP